jgi:hypothetical protein
LGAFLQWLIQVKHEAEIPCLEVTAAVLGHYSFAHDYHGTAKQRVDCLWYGYTYGADPFYLSQPGGTHPDGSKKYGGREVVNCDDVGSMASGDSRGGGDPRRADADAECKRRDPSTVALFQTGDYVQCVHPGGAGNFPGGKNWIRQ